MPVAFPRIRPFPRFSLGNTQRLQSRKSCPYSFPLFPNIRPNFPLNPFIHVLHKHLHVRNRIVSEPSDGILPKFVQHIFHRISLIPSGQLANLGFEAVYRLLVYSNSGLSFRRTSQCEAEKLQLQRTSRFTFGFNFASRNRLLLASTRSAAR